MFRSQTLFTHRPSTSFPALTIVVTSVLLSVAIAAVGQAPAGPQFVQPRDRITSFIANEQTVRWRGNMHPLALAQHDAGVVAPNYPMEHMVLTLLPDPAQ